MLLLNFLRRAGRLEPALRKIVAASVVSVTLANVAMAGEQPNSLAPQSSKGTTMLTASFAKHSKFIAQPSEQGAIRKFFREVLGIPQIRESEKADIFRLGPQFFLGVMYESGALPAETMQKSIWLELATSDPDAMKAAILAGGGKEIEYRDKKHFYFQAPGGQVFRLISDVEDTSAWER